MGTQLGGIETEPSRLQKLCTRSELSPCMWQPEPHVVTWLFSCCRHVFCDIGGAWEMSHPKQTIWPATVLTHTPIHKSSLLLLRHFVALSKPLLELFCASSFTRARNANKRCCSSLASEASCGIETNQNHVLLKLGVYPPLIDWTRKYIFNFKNLAMSN